MRQRFVAGLMATALSAGLFVFGAPAAHASSKGRKNTTIAIGALSAYELLKGHTKTGLLSGAAAAYAYTRYRKSRKAEKRRLGLINRR